MLRRYLLQLAHDFAIFIGECAELLGGVLALIFVIPVYSLCSLLIGRPLRYISVLLYPERQNTKDLNEKLRGERVYREYSEWKKKR